MYINKMNKDKDITITFSRDEICHVCNYMYRGGANSEIKGMDLYSDLTIARDIVDYGHIDSFTLDKAVQMKKEKVFKTLREE